MQEKNPFIPFYFALASIEKYKRDKKAQGCSPIELNKLDKIIDRIKTVGETYNALDGYSSYLTTINKIKRNLHLMSTKTELQRGQY